MDLPAILAIIGGIALLVGILGGGVEAKEIKIPSVSKQARNLSTISGIVLIGISIFTYLFKPPASQEVTTSTPISSSAANASAPITETTISSSSTSPLTWELTYKNPKLARNGMSAAYDSYRQVIVMFGGLGMSESNKNIPLAETWEYDGNNWYQAYPTTSPPPRKWFGMAYDLQRKVIIMFGGQNKSTLNDNWENLHDTWEYDGNNWKLIQTASSPPPLSEFGFVYDSCRQKVVLFGGIGINGLSRSTWEYDGTNWEEINTFVSPPARSLFPMVFDSYRCRSLLFGGGSENFIAVNDTWEYDGTNWEQKNTEESPSPRWGHSMVFNPITKKILLFGGYGPQWPDGKESLDTWEFTGTNWVELLPGTSPSYRQQTILAFDGNQNSIILFGGDTNGETWKLVEK